MKDFILLVEKFEGIIGALLGVMMTLIMTEVFKKMGKFNFFLIKSDATFKREKSAKYGTYENVDKKLADIVTISLVLEVFNSSDTPKILRDIKFNFYKNDFLILSVVPEKGNWSKKETFVNLNMKPKEIIYLEMSKDLNREQTELIKQCNKINFEVKDAKNKLYKVQIAEI